ncbi:hypothetical protein [Actinomadura sp. 9N407]
MRYRELEFDGSGEPLYTTKRFHIVVTEAALRYRLCRAAVFVWHRSAR